MKKLLLALAFFLPFSAFAVGSFSPATVKYNTTVTLTVNPNVFTFFDPQGVAITSQDDYTGAWSTLVSDPANFGVYHFLEVTDGGTACELLSYANCLLDASYAGNDIPVTYAHTTLTPTTGITSSSSFTNDAVAGVQMWAIWANNDLLVGNSAQFDVSTSPSADCDNYFGGINCNDPAVYPIHALLINGDAQTYTCGDETYAGCLLDVNFVEEVQLTQKNYHFILPSPVAFVASTSLVASGLFDQALPVVLVAIGFLIGGIVLAFIVRKLRTGVGNVFERKSYNSLGAPMGYRFSKKKRSGYYKGHSSL